MKLEKCSKIKGFSDFYRGSNPSSPVNTVLETLTEKGFQDFLFYRKGLVTLKYKSVFLRIFRAVFVKWKTKNFPIKLCKKV